MKQKNKATKRTVFHTIGQGILWIITAISIIGLLAACFGGNFNPGSIKGISLMILTLPVWIVLWLVVSILDALWCRKALVFCILTFIACANAIWDYFPLNIFPPSAKKYAECPKFTLLSYNIADFHDFHCDEDRKYNHTVSYIINTNADIVCLQETNVQLTAPNKRLRITAEQIDSISRLYPYQMIYGGYLTILSKYPVESIHTPPLDNDPRYKWRYYPIGIFRLNIEGLPVTLFNVHLQSYSLSKDDKALYKNIAEGKEITDAAEESIRTRAHEIKDQIYAKVQNAAVKRAEQANILGRYIERFGGPNVIIAGDFNDVSGCYTLRRLADYNMREVYPRIGFGPMITFNADMFYFRIDHVLYRGNLVPLKMSRGSLNSSDHYPVLTTFAITASDTEK